MFLNSKMLQLSSTPVTHQLPLLCGRVHLNDWLVNFIMTCCHWLISHSRLGSEWNLGCAYFLGDVYGEKVWFQWGWGFVYSEWQWTSKGASGNRSWGWGSGICGKWVDGNLNTLNNLSEIVREKWRVMYLKGFIVKTYTVCRFKLHRWWKRIDEKELCDVWFLMTISRIEHQRRIELNKDNAEWKQLIVSTI